MLSGKRILLGVTGSIAAYKAVYLLREFQKAGADVRVTMTPSATRFVGIDTFSALSRSDVAVNIFPGTETDPSEFWARHIQWSEWADIFVIAPCSANTLAKIVHGLSDNMLTSTVLAARCPIVICPTMDGGMYQAPATEKNLKTAFEYGYHILQPEEGYLASGLNDIGRLPEPDRIISYINEILNTIDNDSDKKPLSGNKVVVTAGPTREFIDPVRFISNPSSGKMGLAMAEAARDMGGDVTILHGPVNLEFPHDVNTESFISAAELFEKIKAHSDADVIIMSAAVSDFTPSTYTGQKIKKETAENQIPLKPTQDILFWLGEHKRSNQILIGFAMETENLIENAKEKLTKKNLDWIVANSVNEEDSGFQVDTNNVVLLGKESKTELGGTKREVAWKILQYIFTKQESNRDQ